MFLKHKDQRDKITGERKRYYRLCEGYRAGNVVRSHTILYLGTLEELPGWQGKVLLVKRIEQLVEQERKGASLFESVPIPSEVEELAQKFYQEIKLKERLDIPAGKDVRRVDINSVKNRNVREVGSEWLCLQAVNQLGIKDYLKQVNWSEEQISLAVTHIVSRAVYPASELRSSQWIRENSSICELTGYPVEKITKDRLYWISHQLYKEKDGLEQYLSRQTNELFDLKDRIILYDLTNTYFEGQMRASKLARFERSKEKRSDARLVVLAMVVNTEGFVKYSKIFEGNTADSRTLDRILEQLKNQTIGTGNKPVVVLDAGISTEDNLELLKTEGYEYMCVSRTKMKRYRVDRSSNPVHIIDEKKKQHITLQRIKIAGSKDNYLHVHSEAKERKESSMNSRMEQRFEEGLQQVREGVCKKGGTKKYEKVWERIGRLKAKYPTVHKYYAIEVDKSEHDLVIDVRWRKKKVDKKEGQYLLRTNINEKDSTKQWLIYNTIREIEYTFRVLKTDLDLRPIYHKTDAATMAHLHLGILAYWVVNTIRYQLKQRGINSEWRNIMRTMNTQKLVTTTMKTDKDQQVCIRKSSEPTPEVKQIYICLNYKPLPFRPKKSVDPILPNQKNTIVDNQLFMSG
jgi:hypothetical protein